MRLLAIIPAGGKGTRSGFNLPKQYLKIKGKELIVYTLEVFQKNRSVDEIIIAADPFYFNLLYKLKKKYSISKLNLLVDAGKERQNSVYNGLISLSASENDLILVHDAVRPLLPASVLSNAIKIAKEKGNAIVCIKAKDTLIHSKALVEKYIDRDNVWYVQTPQIFKYSVLKIAMNNAIKDTFNGTDESMLVQRLNHKISIVEGSVFNFKVTSKEDIKFLIKLVSSPHNN
ncbi:MAG: 2-C-methyl-D-erythritol 4-phosphate cytidylyltransferase [Ignavibacteriaceae bacterium]|nr:2-C-methyl-D-erythritol 4-phosphate cytidylyltransferase [Ignavibacteriaceae bacterium]